jgi:hypothetical protein
MVSNELVYAMRDIFVRRMVSAAAANVVAWVVLAGSYGISRRTGHRFFVFGIQLRKEYWITLQVAAVACIAGSLLFMLTRLICAGLRALQRR